MESGGVRLAGIGFTALWLLVGCDAGVGFPEDQRLEGPFEITNEWQEIEFDAPLRINREGSQGFHFEVDETRYRPNSHFDLEDRPNQANLRRTDGVLVKPEVILIGDNGERVELQAVSNIHLYAGGLTVGFRTYVDHSSPSPPFPDGITAFRAVKVRSNEPFTAEYLRWRVDNHPDHHRCGGRRCTWLDKLFR
ncbi:MAG: hypothetical protein JJU06_12855 [Ectothiorhodospiraceae bacterium]|nr:hypothetical protein [Ectothiorhodospiraceae bacterium]MCH8504963.1 hypothetical protein [Ectothiorhodospiraceae bacterium]